jgi:hypothetical protein
MPSYDYAHRSGVESIPWDRFAALARKWANPMPDVVAFTTDALVLFPRDAQVYIGSQWQPHPELVEALKHQPNVNY